MLKMGKGTCLKINKHSSPHLLWIQLPSEPRRASASSPAPMLPWGPGGWSVASPPTSDMKKKKIKGTKVFIQATKRCGYNQYVNRYVHQTCNWFQWNRLRIRNRLRFVWIQNRNRLRSTIFPLESESDSTPLVLEQNRSRLHYHSADSNTIPISNTM